MVTLLLIIAASEPIEKVRKDSVIIFPFESASQDAALAAAMFDTFVAQASRNQDYRTVTEADVKATLGIEEKKQIVGCTSSDCAANLAGALDAQYFVRGSVQRAAEMYVVNIRRVSTSSLKTVAHFTESISIGANKGKQLLATMQEASASVFGGVTAQGTPMKNLDGPGRQRGSLALKSEPPVVMASLDRALVMAVFSKNTAQIESCYRRGLEAQPTLAGVVNLQMSIEADGRVRRARVSKTTLKDKVTEECIVERVLSWRFPSPMGGGAVDINVPYVLSPGE